MHPEFSRTPARPGTRRLSGFNCLGYVALLALGLSARADWPEFRGPTGDGHVSAPGATKPIGLPLHWNETNHVVWKTPIPFHGQSTPVIQDGQIWLTTATEEGNDLYVIGVDEKTGKIRFNELVFHTDQPEPLGNGKGMNCYATPTPVLEHGRLYVHFGSPFTACLDTHTGKVLWRREDLRCRHYRGPSSSVVSFGKTIILTFDGADLQYLVALDKETGKTVWTTKRSVAWHDEDVPGPMARDGDLRKAHSTPLVVTANGRPLLLSAGAKAAYGYDPQTGKELWMVRYPDFSTAPRPVFGDGLAYFVSGMSKGELIAVKTDGAGDITDTKVAWKAKTHTGKYASPLLLDGLIYTAADEAFLTCLDAATGQVVWSERVGGKFAASPIYADGRIYWFDRAGLATIIKPGRELKILASNQLDDGFMASPAVDGKALYLRTLSALYRVESPTPETE
ncbi:MAG TPA: PQQ-binding-like beta-propeller repeat protein [Candidatus Limnocylindria bacterium]|nr:PQQ-binding-like beta-propeller repeat protein [Candidatus Limnocylindria bacterium]